MKMTSAEVRNAFLSFFNSKNHQIVASSSLVPHDDPTLLFTNAGMNQFKDVFLGIDKRNYSRATTSQRCVRAGGKHNDLENVGYTARHHTFFEMLGNFSFGDYFKEEAIGYAWEFLTDVVKLPKEKLLVTVYQTDDEAFDLWANKIGVPKDRIIRIGDKSPEKKFESDNFWQMGDTGPCGPCTEIFYDHGEHIWGGPPGTPEEDGDRFIEIWNVVFMQFNRQADGSMEPLPNPSVDTGMGLERIAAILQGVHSNYEIDIFQNLIAAAANIIGTSDLENKSLRVIADHIRSCGFLIADGVMPANEGRGYVLRRIIRRAVRHGNKLGATEGFFYKLLPALIAEMGEAYPELSTQQPVIERVLKLEEEQFAKTLDRGLMILDEALNELEGSVIPGDLVFKLYDTYGFPADLTADIARERELSVDEAEFEAAMRAQRERAKQASNFGTDYNDNLIIDSETEFLGYQHLEAEVKIVEMFKDGEAESTVSSGEQAIIVLDKTPFYAESGGQAGDAGELMYEGGSFVVQDTIKVGKAFVHKGYVQGGDLCLQKVVKAKVDSRRRWNTALNHSVTHILHAALRQTLGEHVTQKGSLVEAQRLRFDFSHFEAVSMKSIRQIEHLVNQQIRRNLPVITKVMNLDQAKDAGAMALFGEKYDDDVRVVSMGDFSTELCGGTHVNHTGDIGFFKITSEAGIAAGVRRIEAVTGQFAIDLIHRIAEEMEKAANLVKGDQFSIGEKVMQLVDRNKMLEKDVAQLKAKLASAASNDAADQIQTINGVKVLIAFLDGVEGKALRSSVDELKVKLESGVILLATVNDGKVSLVAGVTKDLTSRVKAGEMVNIAAQCVGGKGGGRPDMAQAGGSNPDGLQTALEKVKEWLNEQL
ncbi:MULTISPECIES: alanine--tRNA ligase [unclassified Agarivorans]|uniref:alanine--tRNA ligase n=1 Tax=unclassified Agarivorans TaxID=2636026 RepID=UPI0026E43704|nr:MULTISPECIES: alanine--tRNA ligase [unclassified Agarivorans]MDO6684279.1 alanine--tRNA ligase [Agarivorans sp. 3_MG-2023]MDO6714445.1 alanine--tRNA ligase [Agarivorans sp. 2_MG-2023]